MDEVPLRPVAVMDSRKDWPPANFEDVLDWASREGIDLGGTYRIEVYLLDCPFARVFTYDRDERGSLRLDATHAVVCRDPYDVVIAAMPPVPHTRNEPTDGGTDGP